MNTISQGLTRLAADEVETIILRLQTIVLVEGHALHASELRRLDRASESLEAARMDLRAILGLRPLSDLPMGATSPCGDGQASSGSRRSD